LARNRKREKRHHVKREDMLGADALATLDAMGYEDEGSER
jgi:hypothetical protein